MPQLENGYTKIANELLEELAKIRIPGEARQVLDVIFRKTYGFNKKSDIIPLSQFMFATGLKKTAVCKAIAKLISMNLIMKTLTPLPNLVMAVTQFGNGMAGCFELIKDYEIWRPLPKKVTLPKKTIAPLPKKGNSKETIQSKEIKKETHVFEIPESLNTPDFLDAWELWKKHRQEIKKPLKNTTMLIQLRRLESEGATRSIEAIMNSIENGWQGFVWEKVRAEKADEWELDEIAVAAEADFQKAVAEGRA